MPARLPPAQPAMLEKSLTSKGSARALLWRFDGWKLQARRLISLGKVANQHRVPCNGADLVHIEMPVHRFDPSDLLVSRERMLHNAINSVF